MTKPTKEFVSNYKCYSIYKITDSSGKVFYNAISTYVGNGFVTFAEDTLPEIYTDINNIYGTIRVSKALSRIR